MLNSLSNETVTSYLGPYREATYLSIARMSRFTHSMFNFKFFCVNSTSLKFNGFTSLGYEQQNKHTSALSVHQHVQCFDISRELGYRMRGRRPGISTARLFLPHDQIMTFD